MSQFVKIKYRNHRSEACDTSESKVAPVALFYGLGDPSGLPQWMLRAYDPLYRSNRVFSLARVLAWGQEAIDEYHEALRRAFAEGAASLAGGVKIGGVG